MKVLALDTSQIQAAVCLVEDGEILHSAVGSTSVSHSESLLKIIDGVLKDAKISLSDIDAFGCGVGPGSFTGIRIGCSTIKALAQVLKKPVYAFSSLKALAFSSPQANKAVTQVGLVNAYQGQVFVGWDEIEDAMPATLWLENHLPSLIQKGAVSIAVSQVPSIIPQLASLGSKVMAFETLIQPSGVAAALKKAKKSSYLELQARYLRPSQAEIKLAQTKS